MADGALVNLSVTLGSAAEISRLRLCFEALTCEGCHEPYRPQVEPWQLWPADEAAKARIEEALADFEPGLEHYEASSAGCMRRSPRTGRCRSRSRTRAARWSW